MAVCPAIAITLPPEIWAIIFEGLTSAEHKSLSLTCYSFRFIAQPLLFRRVVMRLQLSKITSYSYRKLGTVDARQRERLAFFLTSPIAPVVRTVCVIPHCTSRRSFDGGSIRQNVDEALVNEIFDALPSFPNLSDLSFHLIGFSTSRLDSLRTLPLKNISLHSCYITTSSLPPPLELPLQSVVITNAGPSSHAFLSVPFLFGPRAVPGCLVSSDALTTPASSLQELDIPLEAAASSHFMETLAGCRGLKSLSLRPQSLDSGWAVPSLGTVPPNLLPALSYFYGPHSYIPSICRNIPLVSLGISVPCSASEVEQALAELGPSTTVESIFIRVHSFPASLLNAIHHTFPKLLRMEIRDPVLAPAAWLAAFRDVEQHHSLCALYIPVHVTDPNELWMPPVYQVAHTIKFFVELHLHLRKLYPALKRVMLMYDSPAHTGKQMALLWELMHSDGQRSGYDALEFSVEVNATDVSDKGRPLSSKERKMLCTRWMRHRG